MDSSVGLLVASFLQRLVLDASICYLFLCIFHGGGVSCVCLFVCCIVLFCFAEFVLFYSVLFCSGSVLVCFGLLCFALLWFGLFWILLHLIFSCLLFVAFKILFAFIFLYLGETDDKTVTIIYVETNNTTSFHL